MIYLSIGDKIKELDINERIFGNLNKEGIMNLLTNVLTQLLATLVVVFLLIKFLWKPAKKYIDARKNYVATNIEEAEKKNAEAGELLSAAQAKINASEDEAAEIVKNAKKQAQIEADKIIDSASKAAKDKMDQVNLEIESAKRESLEEIRKEIVDVAILAAGKVVEREINEDDNKKFLKDFVKDVTNE